jgi:hypothetical protein
LSSSDLVVLDLAGRSFVIDVVRRIRENHVYGRFVEKTLHVRFLGRVAAHDAMIPKQVDVPLFGILSVGDFLRRIEIVVTGVIRNIRVKILEAEPKHIHINMRQLFLELLEVPGGELGSLVIRQAEGLDLGFREVIGDDARNSGQPELLARLEPCMAGNDHIVLGDDDWNLEAEFLDTRRDSIDRRLVISWIVFVLE